jgi:hypothetical protein
MIAINIVLFKTIRQPTSSPCLKTSLIHPVSFTINKNPEKRTAGLDKINCNQYNEKE